MTDFSEIHSDESSFTADTANFAIVASVVRGTNNRPAYEASMFEIEIVSPYLN